MRLRLKEMWATGNDNFQPYILFRFVKANRIFLPLGLSFLFTFSMKVFRSVRDLSLMVVSFFGIIPDCSIYLGTKPN